MNFKSYKLVICILVALVCMTLAIRVKGKILLLWISIIGRYNLRPRYYIFNKNDSHLRSEPEKKQSIVPEKAIKSVNTYEREVKRDVTLTEMVRLEHAVADPRANFHFKTTKKGGLRVFISEVK